jgi:hypothetical protein
VPLVYTWRIEAIYRCLAARGRTEVEETDLSGRYNYILRCELLPVPPKNSSITAP